MLKGKRVAVLSILMFLLFVGGCSFDFVSVDNLMRAPKLTGIYGELEQAFEASVGDAITLQSPRSGSYRTAFVLHDIDGDFVDEALVFYTLNSDASTVHIHFLDYVNDEWISAGDETGSEREIHELLFKDRLKYAWEQVVSTARKVFPYVLAGVGIGAVIHNWIPEAWVVAALGGNNPFGVLIATIVGVPMYADIFGTIPIAEALLAKGALLGVVLSFMMAVTTLSLPSLIMLRKAVKPKLLGIFIAICAAGIVTVGYIFNVIQRWII